MCVEMKSNADLISDTQLKVVSGYLCDLLPATANCVSGVTASSLSCPPLWTSPVVWFRVYFKPVPITSCRALYVTCLCPSTLANTS